MVNFENLINHFKDPTKEIDFNDFIYPKTVFDDIKSKKRRFGPIEKNQMDFESKLNNIRKSGNKSNKQVSEKGNIPKF